MGKSKVLFTPVARSVQKLPAFLDCRLGKSSTFRGRLESTGTSHARSLYGALSLTCRSNSYCLMGLFSICKSAPPSLINQVMKWCNQATGLQLKCYGFTENQPCVNRM